MLNGSGRVVEYPRSPAPAGERESLTLRVARVYINKKLTDESQSVATPSMTSLDCGAIPPLLFFLLTDPKQKRRENATLQTSDSAMKAYDVRGLFRLGDPGGWQ